MASLGQRVRDFRYFKGWGPDELASRAEISRTAIYQIENGKTGSPHASTLRRIAVALDVSMDELLGHPESTAHQTTRTVTDHAVSASPGRECADWMPADGGLLALLPHEDPKQLEDRIQQWITDMQPRNAVERDLVCHAARLAHRVRQAARTQTQKVSARRLKKVRDLGRKLLYIAGPGTDSSPGPPWDDEPAVFVRGLEESAEGCHWLLERWAEFRNLLDRKAGWSWPEMFRFIRLQGKHSIEAVYDPALNSIFLAWEVLFPKSGHGFWNPCKNRMASDDPAHNSLLVWREIAPRPRDKTEALAVLSSVVDQHIGRLAELLAKYKEIEEEEAAERCDRAALDSSPAFEGHRRYQSTQTRELLRTLDTLRRMRNAERGMEKEKWRMTNGAASRGQSRGSFAGSDLILQPIMPLDLPVKKSGRGN